LLRLQHELENVHLIPLAGAGHQVPQTHPQAVVDAVRGLAAAIETVAAKPAA
jgi:pimeloyl-ACP methyl ester carboxylesterase